MVRGKNKEQFKEFYNNINGGNYKIPYKNFMAYPLEMQIGVYLAYYDSLGVYINLEGKDSVYYYSISDLIVEHYYSGKLNIKRNEAYKEAFKKANELTNNKN